MLPNLSFVIPAANENRWSDLFAALITADPAPLAALLGVTFDAVRREVTVPGQAGRKSDRLDLLLLNGGREVAAIEVKRLSEAVPNDSATRPADKPPTAAAAPTPQRTPPPNDKADEDGNSTPPHHKTGLHPEVVCEAVTT